MKVEFGTIVAVDCPLGIASVKLASDELVFNLKDRYIPRKDPWEDYPRRFTRWLPQRRSGSSFVLPAAGETIALLREFSPYYEHAWITEADWDWCLEQDDYLPDLRVVRFKDGRLAEIIWQGDRDEGGRMQLRKLSLLFPRTYPYGSDLIAASHLAHLAAGPMGADEGLFIQKLMKVGDTWETTVDCRAPLKAIPPYSWGLDLAPITTAVK